MGRGKGEGSSTHAFCQRVGGEEEEEGLAEG